MARAGQKIKLECEATGVPLPELSWEHDGKSIKQNKDIKVSFALRIYVYSNVYRLLWNFDVNPEKYTVF